MKINDEVFGALGFGGEDVDEKAIEAAASGFAAGKELVRKYVGLGPHMQAVACSGIAVSVIGALCVAFRLGRWRGTKAEYAEEMVGCFRRAFDHFMAEPLPEGAVELVNALRARDGQGPIPKGDE